MDVNQALDTLKSLSTYSEAVELFGALGYSDAADAPIPRRLLPHGVPVGDAKYLAERGGFKILYIPLESERLSRAEQRKVIDRLIREHPFCLFVFRNNAPDTTPTQAVWEFINVRYGKSETSQQQRKLIRRITVGASERIQNRLRTAAERLTRLNLSARPTISPLEIQRDIHDAAFDVEQVTRDFYLQYVGLFQGFADAIATNNPALDKAHAEHEAQLLLDRLMFLYFIQKKGWLNAEDDYLYGRFASSGRLALTDTTFYRNVIAPLFKALAGLPTIQAESVIGQVPFLNGGLFQFDAGGVSLGLTIPNSAFNSAFNDLFERYAFTIEEDTPLDKAVAIDPEMLGKVFETFVLKREQDKDLRKATGSYYTPRNIVSFMCQQSLQAYLTGRWRAGYQAVSPDGQLPIVMNGKGGQIEMRSVELQHHEQEYVGRLHALIEGDSAADLSKVEARQIREWLYNARVIDPAVGSGAFLVGMMQEIVALITLLDQHIGDRDTTARNYVYTLKRHLIEAGLYGVDLQEQAVRICELRLWLSLVVEFEPEKDGRPIRDWLRDVRPLPNLSYRIRGGNSLIEQVMGEPLQLNIQGASNALLETIREIRDEKLRYFGMTDPDEKRRTQAAILMHKATLTRDYLDFMAKKLDGKLNTTITMNVPGMEPRPPTRAEVTARKALETERDHLRELVARADTIRRDAEALRAPGRDMDKLVTLERDLGSFIWKIDFSDAFSDEKGNGGFDICIGNPPYIRQERIKDQKPALERLYKNSVYAGTADLYVYFYAKGLSLLREGGILSFISPNKFLRAGYGERLRDYLSTQTRIEMLVDFGDLPVFDATTYPLVAVIRKGKPTADAALSAVNIHDMEQLDMLPQIVNTVPPMPQTELRVEGWQLADPATLRLMSKLRSVGTPLGEYVDGKLYRGIVTGFNDAFVIDSATRDRLIAADPKSDEVIKPWLRGQDVKRWRTEWDGLYVIFTRRGIDIQVYPAIKTYLEQFKDRLLPGVDGGRKAGSYEWYEIQDNIAYFAEFGKSKIVYPDIAKTMAFTYDTDGYFTGNTTYFIPLDEQWIVGILNASTIAFFYHQVSPRIQNDYYRFFSQYVLEIPIPTVAADLRAEIESTVRGVLDVRGQGESVAALEKQLNALVYRAYGLTPDEIRLIEGDPTLAQIQAAHPDQWVVMEVTKRKDGVPERGVVVYAGTDREKADQITGKENKTKMIYTFFSDAGVGAESTAKVGS